MKNDRFEFLWKSFDLKIFLIKNSSIMDDDLVKKLMNEVIEEGRHHFPGIYDESFNEGGSNYNKFKRTIYYNYYVKQDDGIMLPSDYEADVERYNKLLEDPNFDQYYWERYKRYLTDNTRVKIDTLESNLNKIISYIGDPRSNKVFSIRGLVMGDVQSGKTSNYIGLMTKAADLKYKVIILLTGTIENLRRQTQIRVEEGFVGFDSTKNEHVGVGAGGTRAPRCFTSRDNDFVSLSNLNTNAKLSYDSEVLVFVIKKNLTVLNRVLGYLKKVNIQEEGQKINFPLLVIDDEADNASINTNTVDCEPTKINNKIREILSLFSQSTYVGFTATPFANVFILYDKEEEMVSNDLFPKDFIYYIKPPSNYLGAKRYFGGDASFCIKTIKDDDPNIFRIDHKNFEKVEGMFGSFYEAINLFLLANAIRDLDEPKTHRSMLINMSRFKSVHFDLEDLVKNYYEDVKRSLKQTIGLPYRRAIKNEHVKSLEAAFNKEYANQEFNGTYLSFEIDIFPILYNAIKNIEIKIVNSASKNDSLFKNEDGERLILIGGLALSRGLTLEGLIISYFYRKPGALDTLMQMGRWFGYRFGYENLCRVYLCNDSENFYKELNNVVDNLISDIEYLVQEHKRPKDFAMKVKSTDLAIDITSRNKRRNTVKRVVKESFYGRSADTTYLYNDVSISQKNVKRSLEFANKIFSQYVKTKKGIFFKDVNKSLILEFLKGFNVPEKNPRFRTNTLINFIKKADDLDLFDVLYINGESNKVININGNNLRLTERSIVVKNNYVILGGEHAHLIGPRDYKRGLPEEYEDIKSKNAEDYLIKGRKPLMIIYLIVPMTQNNVDNEEKVSTENFINEIKRKENDFICGVALGFPNNKINEKRDEYIYNESLYKSNISVDEDESDETED